MNDVLDLGKTQARGQAKEHAGPSESKTSSWLCAVRASDWARLASFVFSRTCCCAAARSFLTVSISSRNRRCSGGFTHMCLWSFALRRQRSGYPQQIKSNIAHTVTYTHIARSSHQAATSSTHTALTFSVSSSARSTANSPDNLDGDAPGPFAGMYVL